MNIYCSKKLETFIGKIQPLNTLTEKSIFGDWNAHFFTINRKKCLIFMNNKTCYCILIINVHKKDLKDFQQVFTTRLFKQLYHDLKITENQEIIIRQHIKSIELCKSNNDKKIIGTINHFVENLKYYGIENGDFELMNEVEVAGYLNDSLLGTKIIPNMKRNRNYIKPNELMVDLIEQIT